MAKLKTKTLLKEIGQYLVFLIIGLIVVLQAFPLFGLKSTYQKSAQLPWSITNRIHLAETLFLNGQIEAAQKEVNKISQSRMLSIALSLRPKLKSEYQAVSKLVFTPSRINAKIDYWKQVLLKKPNYRDAYLELAILYYQIKDDQKSKQMWQKAFNLDPNGEKVKKVESIVFEGETS